VICRWVHKDSGLRFDLMPVQPEVLGLSNRCYPYAVETAEPVQLGPAITIRLVSAIAFVATKLEAFAGRGGGDFLNSHDLEDVLNIADGREELASEMAAPCRAARGRGRGLPSPAGKSGRRERAARPDCRAGTGRSGHAAPEGHVSSMKARPAPRSRRSPA
jgi:hypothetical protein